ncbi:hypothetical protein D1007_30209 [Hordeum vulgare]|nr:hypothetical protein D1007_30209 [Hordeum vulgare]
MHHLGVNVVLYISCFVSLCEGYLGLRPFPLFFHHFFYFRTQKHGSVPYSYGGAMIYRRSGLPFPAMTFKDSFNKWQQTFFYICSLDETRDWVGLQAFVERLLVEMNWKIEPTFEELNGMVGQLRQFMYGACRGLLRASSSPRRATLMAGAPQASSSLGPLASNLQTMAADNTPSSVLVSGNSYQIVNIVSTVATTRATQVRGASAAPPAPTTCHINLGDLSAYDALQMANDMLRH